VVNLLRERFVAVAVDNANNINLTPSERAWLADRGGRACTQGMTVLTAGGKVLASGGGFDPASNRRMLEQALARFRPDAEPPEVAPLNAQDCDAVPEPPRGGLALYVSWKVLGGFEAPAKPGAERHANQNALGVDRLWVRKDEAEALARGGFPDSLRGRMLRYHVAPVFGKEVEHLDLVLRDGHVTGSFRAGCAGEAGALRGVVEVKGGKVTRLDLLLRGPGRGVKNFGFMAGLEAVPEGEPVPVALFFSLADPADSLSRLPPHRTWRQLDAYLR
jgi:hypothetical protein